MSQITEKPLRSLLILEPAPARLSALILISAYGLGVLYASGYHLLLRDIVYLEGSLIWSAFMILPWLILFELNKRHEVRSGHARSPLQVAGLVTLTLALSAIAHAAVFEFLVGPRTAPFFWHILRRLPAAGITFALIMLAQHERRKVQSRSTAAAHSQSGGELDALLLHARDVRWIRSADNYLEWHFADEVWMRRLTMREAEAALKPFEFVRIHRSVLVNRAHVRRVLKQSRRSAVEMDDGTFLPTGKAFVGNLCTLV